MCGTDKRSDPCPIITKSLSSDSIINLDHGDPTMYKEYWERMGDKCSITITGWQSLSYFSNTSNICWFLEPEFEKEVRRIHSVVGNAVADHYHIVVGNGSSQLFQAALYALSPANALQPMNVVSAAPYYSSYPALTEFLKSGLYKWAGDACNFDKEEPYIELVTSPNNPDGFIREAVANCRKLGKLVHDLAYYWPQYTAITAPADHDVMLFTVSKCTGHAGTRIGWALVKDREVARKMTKFIELNTIGVSKDSQLRAAKILQVLSNCCECARPGETENFFEHFRGQMTERWDRLRGVVKGSDLFSLPEYPVEFCNFFGDFFEAQPAFAWLKCGEEIEDCESFLKNHKIITRSGRHFGENSKYVRISMLDKDNTFNLLLQRMSTIIQNTH
ncbi:hypothetical protein Syun_024166 [Stephania yunnanensis]|uniref:Alliinase C-terminal domain-containing protein n=1 Tax=Stephania yunnanensis TaxID=152371 RepID=A0AAP0FEI1_9MAGN